MLSRAMCASASSRIKAGAENKPKTALLLVLFKNSAPMGRLEGAFALQQRNTLQI
jgi:hypothetical protein